MRGLASCDQGERYTFPAIILQEARNGHTHLPGLSQGHRSDPNGRANRAALARQRPSGPKPVGVSRSGTLLRTPPVVRTVGGRSLDTLFLMFTAPLYRWQGNIYVEDQTISGLAAWNDNFGKVIACSNTFYDQPPPEGWSDPWSKGLDPGRVELIELPYGYDLKTFARERQRVSRLLLDAMTRADYRVCGIGGWIGDWGNLCAGIARRNKLVHAVWFDRVESQVIGSSPRPGWIGALIARIKSAVTAYNEEKALASADLALLNGRTVFERFGPMTRNPHLVADIHIDDDDRISEQALEAKKAAAGTGPLKVCYAGRTISMKGPDQWLDALERVIAQGHDITATWLGDGDMLEAMRRRVAEGPLNGKVSLEGFVSDRDHVIDTIRQSHVLLFCHVTDESPRVLVEALLSGTPLVGFRDPYAESLVTESDGGILVQRGDSLALSEKLATLARDRDALCALIDRAAASARHLTRSRVFAHRSELVRTYLKSEKGRSQ